VQVRCDGGVAIHIGPEPCVVVREGGGEASVADHPRLRVCSCLALVLKARLEQRIAAPGCDGSWPEIRADLDSLTETEIVHDGRRFLVRGAPRAATSLALRAVSVALPPTLPPSPSD